MDSRLIFRDAAGRELTMQDLQGYTGTVDWAIVGDGHVPVEAHELHQAGRAAGGDGDYELALTLFARAQQIAPDWPYPCYDAAYTYLLQGDADQATTLYEQVHRLAPRGFFTCVSTLYTLRRERAGTLFPGFAQAFISLEWTDPARKTALLQGIARRFPDFPPAWEKLSWLLTDPDEQLGAIERGLAGDPDPETRAMLLVGKAQILLDRGQRDAAVEILGGLALDPDSHLVGEAHAKFLLAQLFREP